MAFKKQNKEEKGKKIRERLLYTIPELTCKLLKMFKINKIEQMTDGIFRR